MTYGTIIPGAKSILRLPKLSKAAKQRLKWFDYYRQCDNAAKTCRYFGISRKTFHKWKKRYSAYYLPTLENKSRRPKRFRQSKIPREQVFMAKRLRTKYPYYSKCKLAVILKRDYHILLSPSTIGRIIKKNNLFFKPKYPSKKKRYASRIAIERKRLPKDYDIQIPGDLIESDMKHMPFLGRKRYAFVAIDCVGKGIAIKISATSSSLQNATLIG